MRGPLHKDRQLFCFLLLDRLRVEGDFVFLQRGGAPLVEEEFHGEGPHVEADEGAEKGFVGEESGGHGNVWAKLELRGEMSWFWSFNAAECLMLSGRM